MSKAVFLFLQIYTLRYFLKFAYCGTHFFGFQRQPKQLGVQQAVEEALSILLREEIAITGAGRTDTGVHAKEMYAHFNTEKSLPKDFVYRLNALTKEDVAFYECIPVTEDAHARFDAVSRTYEYHICYRKNPFEKHLSWQLWNRILDFDAMKAAEVHLLGKKDFSSFEKKGSDNMTSICEVTEAFWQEKEHGIYFTITANRFLRNMVRSIVGTLAEVGMGKRRPEDLPQLIEERNRSEAGLSVPADGLYLTQITYPETIWK